MIYTKKQVTTSRQGRQYENTCKGCSRLLCLSDSIDEVAPTCHKYPGMENQVRCIDYTTETLTQWNNYLYLGEGKKY